MTPEVVEKGAICLAGFAFYGDPFSSSSAWTEENEIGRLWKRFDSFCSGRREEFPPSAVQNLGYEVHIWNEDTFTTGHYEMFVGFALDGWLSTTHTTGGKTDSRSSLKSRMTIRQTHSKRRRGADPMPNSTELRIHVSSDFSYSFFSQLSAPEPALHHRQIVCSLNPRI